MKNRDTGNTHNKENQSAGVISLRQFYMPANGCRKHRQAACKIINVRNSQMHENICQLQRVRAFPRIFYMQAGGTRKHGQAAGKHIMKNPSNRNIFSAKILRASEWQSKHGKQHTKKHKNSVQPKCRGSFSANVLHASELAVEIMGKQHTKTST